MAEEEWRRERQQLLEQVALHKTEAQVLAKRFRLLQHTLQQQQTVLERYQRELFKRSSDSGRKRKLHADVPPRKDSKLPRAKENTPPAPCAQAPAPVLQASCLVQAPLHHPHAAPPVTKAPTLPAAPAPLRQTIASTANLAAPGTATAPVAKASNSLSKDAPVATASSSAQVDAASRADRNASRGDQTKPFKYIEVVRKKDERAALAGHACTECAKYYAALGEEFKGQEDLCSRHRARHEPYSTPEDFWRLSFPDSA